MIWDLESELTREPPPWSLTGRMLLWSDGSPAHVQQEPFELNDRGWEARARVSRSTRGGSKWLDLIIRMDAEVRVQWDAQDTNQAERALQSLANYLRLREWYDHDLGVLSLE